jgi:hypothetical protein
MPSTEQSPLYARLAPSLGLLLGIVALAWSLERIVLSAKFGELPLSDKPLLAMLGVAAILLCRLHLRRLARSSHLPVFVVLVGVAALCTAAIYLPGSPLPALVLLHKPWGAFAAAAVVVAACVAMLSLWRSAPGRLLAISLAGAGVAVYLWSIGFLVAALLFSGR